MGPTPYGTDRYSPEAVAANYRDLIHRAAKLLALGESVVLDASWSSQQMRALAREVATSTSSDLVELRCTAPAAIAAARIVARGQRGDDPSEATPETASAMATRFDPWPEATTIDTTRTEVEGPENECVTTL
jgi:predicted kinase